MFCPILFLPLFSLTFVLLCQSASVFLPQKKAANPAVPESSPNKPAHRRRVPGGPLPVKKAGGRAVLKKTDKPTSRERPRARTTDARLPKSRQKSTNPIQYQKKLSKRPPQGNAQEKIRRKFRVSPFAHKKADSALPAAFSETAHFLRQNTPRQLKIQGNWPAGRQKKWTTSRPGGGSQKCAAGNKRTKGQDFS